MGFCYITGVGQNKNFPIEFNFQQRLVGDISHSSLKPLNERAHKIYYKRRYLDSNNYSKKVFKKLFQESLIEIHQEDVNLSVDPLFNFSIGNKHNIDDYRYSINVRGFRVIGDLGNSISFETRFYENQFRYPDYLDSIADSREVAIGIGRSKVFKTYGHDAGIASGYVSYSPADKINFQFGHGRHFFGNGYRSLLLSDYAPDYPYFSGQYSFLKGVLVYKHVTAWMHSLNRRNATTASEPLFKQKGATFNMLSIQPNKKLEIAFFEGAIHRFYIEEVGNIKPDISFYIPVFGMPGLLSDSSSGVNLVYGLNVYIRPLDKIVLYSQLMYNNSSKWGIQAGLKYLEPFNIVNSFLLFEYNHAEPYSYTMDSINTLQSYSHNAHEIAHPLGSGFDELLFKSYAEYHKFFISLQVSLLRREHEENSDLGASVFLENDIISGNYISDKWMYGAIELGYLLNIKTRIQVFAGFYCRGDKFDEKYIMAGLRTVLKNSYFDQ